MHDKMNLSKKFPKYINSTIFRIGFALMIIFIFSLVLNYGFGASWVTVECESYTCNNPYIECEYHNFTNPYINHDECLFYTSTVCSGVNCNKSTIIQGEYFGTKPPKIVKDSKLILLFLLLGTFYFNHLYYELNKNGKLQKL